MGEVLVWPVAASYRVAPGDLIIPEPGCAPHKGVRSFPPPSPLKDPGLYWSFARLARGARSGKRAQQRVLEWVSEHGLLKRQRDDLDGDDLLEDGVVNQALITVADFMDEAVEFASLVRLYAEIRSNDVTAIASRVSRPVSPVDDRLASAVEQRLEPPMELLHTLLQYEASRAPRPLLMIADEVRCEMMADKLDGVRIRPVPGFAIPWETSDEELAQIRAARPRNYVLTDSYSCPDLLSALYLQLHLVTRRRKPVRRCEFCWLPLPETAPRHKHYCNSTCRSRGRKS